ncbi:hypothetical protein BDK51DRAFT_42235 [Blyttiomyces helicus]|uniref:Uncharacterized protein n=1 Tax=Blyttiomyces helicus TaxID=388810 RepID=A0A4P9WKL3_9FUNG|nr:hypothetical protein BDK51DRAFT_42235 [Blyttiomyces helicus]|eukprot:RKO93354.1 hypothetical protein BDK51DRAFT_42235 [Blyttiomyces helicus]
MHVGMSRVIRGACPFALDDFRAAKSQGMEQFTKSGPLGMRPDALVVQVHSPLMISRSEHDYEVRTGAPTPLFPAAPCASCAANPPLHFFAAARVLASGTIIYFPLSPISPDARQSNVPSSHPYFPTTALTMGPLPLPRSVTDPLILAFATGVAAPERRDRGYAEEEEGGGVVALMHKSPPAAREEEMGVAELLTTGSLRTGTKSALPPCSPGPRTSCGSHQLTPVYLQADLGFRLELRRQHCEEGALDSGQGFSQLA